MVPPLVRYYLATLGWFVVLAFVPGPDAFALDGNIVRVCILKDAVMARLSIDGFYSIKDGATGQTLATDKNLTGAVTAFKFAVNIAGKRYSQDRIFIHVDEPDALQVNGRRYHGSLAIVRARGAMALVNYVDLEDYVKGIAVREISHYWPPEALRAMSVVFRTYALYSAQTNARQPFDVTSDTYSQVYGGTSAERYRITDACNDTAGDILAYNGDVFPAYYHSTCGGHTERAGALWDIDIPPLQGVPCPYCTGGPHFSWTASVSAARAAELLKRSGIKLPGALQDVFAVDTDMSGRVTDLELHTRSGERVMVAAKDFRTIIGPDVVKSTRFTVSMRGSSIQMEGTGWGHGVGLCQWGAYFMAKAGYSSAQILDLYYPGSTVMNIHTRDVKE